MAIFIDGLNDFRRLDIEPTFTGRFEQLFQSGGKPQKVVFSYSLLEKLPISVLDGERHLHRRYC